MLSLADTKLEMIPPPRKRLDPMAVCTAGVLVLVAYGLGLLSGCFIPHEGEPKLCAHLGLR
jgi:hypothetical protein